MFAGDIVNVSEIFEVINYSARVRRKISLCARFPIFMGVTPCCLSAAYGVITDQRYGLRRVD